MGEQSDPLAAPTPRQAASALNGSSFEAAAAGNSTGGGAAAAFALPAYDSLVRTPWIAGYSRAFALGPPETVDVGGF